MKRTPKTVEGLPQAAAALGITVDAVRSAKHAGSSAFRPGGRINVPELKAWLRKHPEPESKPPPPPSDMALGAPAMLARAAQEEAGAAAAMRAATSPPERERLTRRWVVLAEFLRRADVAVAEARRDAADMLPRAAVETLMYRCGQALAAAGRVITEGLVSEIRVDPRPENVAKVWRDAYTTRLSLTLGALLQSEPRWLTLAFLRGADGGDVTPMHRAIQMVVEMADQEAARIRGEDKAKPGHEPTPEEAQAAFDRMRDDLGLPRKPVPDDKEIARMAKANDEARARGEPQPTWTK